MAVDSDLAPTLTLKSSMAGSAHTEHAVLVPSKDMGARGIDAEAAMAPFDAVRGLPRAHEAPGLIEGLVKAFVGDGIAKDFYREMSAFVDDETRAVMGLALDDERDPVVARRARHPENRPHGRRRLSPWGRRLLGEALSQAQAVAVERDAMSALLVGGGVDLAEVG